MPEAEVAARATRVALNMLHLVPGETGGAETYIRRLVPALAAAREDLELVMLVGREAARDIDAHPWHERARCVALAVDSRSRTRRVLGEQLLLASAARRSGAQLLHNVFSTAPAISRLPQITTIHDLIYKRVPATHSGLLTRGVALLVPLAARRSRRLIAVSEATRRDLVELLGVNGGKVDVVHHGPGMEEPPDPLPEEELRARLGLGQGPLVLTVSAKRPHKNLERLIDAMASLDSDATLVVPGYATEFEEGLRRRVAQRGAGERVRFAGWLDDAALDGLYRMADCMVFPSLAEGFGLPVLEAMARGTAVACSNTSSLPEIAGPAARYFDPTDTRSIADAVDDLLRDPDLRERLAAAGRERAATFSWQRAARETLHSYDAVLGKPS